ncbi:MAG: glycosyltransferase family 1 protein [Hungatella sp.]|nr:glycosyltransferase family 1 protein [Hungatella sp.]
MKRIIHFSLANSKGGITQYVLNNWKYIDKTRFQFDMVTFGGQLDFEGDLQKEGCRIFYVKNRAEDDLEQFQKEILEVLSRGYDTVHLHTSYWKSFELEKLAKQVGIPQIIVHAHNTGVFDDSEREEKQQQHYRLLENLTPDIATDFCACSNAAANWLYEDKIPKEKIQILNNAIDVESFMFSNQKRKEYRERIGWGNKFIIGHVGRFSYQKNHEFLIEVFKKVVEKNKDARLLLIGKGPLENKVYSLVKRYGLIDKVHFTGICDDVNGWLQAMDMFALPSRFEGLPIVAVEAQSSGLQCLLSDKITRETKITDRVSFLPLDITLWCNRILLLKAGEEDRVNCTEQIRQVGYDIKTYIKILEELYEKD